jgi:hypothetical protein
MGAMQMIIFDHFVIGLPLWDEIMIALVFWSTILVCLWARIRATGRDG